MSVRLVVDHVITLRTDLKNWSEFNKDEIDDVKFVGQKDLPILVKDIEANPDTYTPWFKDTLLKVIQNSKFD